MGVSIAQLNAKITIEGADAAKSSLQSVGSAATMLGEKLSSMTSAGASAGSGIGGFLGSIGGGIGKLFEFGSQVGMTIFGLQQMAQTVVSVGQALLTPAMNAEQMETAFTTLTGSTKAAREEMQQLDAFAAKTPFQTMDIDKAASQLLGFGFNAKQVVPDLTAIGDALSAVGRSSTADLDSVVNIFGKIHNEGKLTGQTMMEFAANGINAFAILQQQTGKTRDQLQAMISSGAIPADDAIKMLTQGIEKNPLYTGGMAKQSGTLAGLLSTLKSNWDQMLTSFGSPIIKALEGSVNNLGNALASQSFKDFAGSVGKGIVDTAQQISTKFQDLKTWLDNVGKAFQTVGFQSFVQSVQNLGHTLSDVLFPKLKPVQDGLKGIFSDQGASAGARGLADAFQFMAGVLNGLNSGIKFMRDTWHATLPVLQQIGGFLNAQFGPVFKQIGDEVRTQLLPAWNQLVTAMQPLMPIFQGIAIVIGAVLVTALGVVIATVVGLAKAFAGMLPGIIQAVSGVIQIFTGLVQFFTGIGHLIYDIVTGNFSKIGADLGEIWGGLVKQAQGLWQVIAGVWNSGIGMVQGFISGFVSTIIGFFTHLWDTLVGHSIIPDMIRSIISWFAGLPGAVISFVSQLVSRAIGFFGVLAQTAIAKASELASGFMSKLQALPGQLLTLGQNLISNLTQGIRNAAGSVTQAAQDIVNNVQNAFSNIHLPNISLPGHASGIMDSPVGHWARVGENGPEVMFVPKGASIFPNNMLSSLASLSSTPSGVQVMPQTMSAGPTQIIVQPPPIYLDGRLLTNGLMPHMADAIRHGTGIWGV